MYDYRESEYYKRLPRDIRELLDDFYSWMLGSMRETTAGRFAWDVARILVEEAFNPLDLDLAKARRVVARVSGMRPGTRRWYVSLMRRLAAYLYEIHGSEKAKEILEKLKSPRVRLPPPETLTPEEAERLLEEARTLKNKALIAVLLEGGLRISEALSLRIGDVEFDEYGAKLYVRQSKTEARPVRIIKYTHILRAWLQSHPQRNNPQAWLFPKATNPDKHMTPQTANNNIKRIARRAGIKKNVHPHILRHTRATMLATRLTDREMMMVFGWKTVEMVRRYTHLTMRDVETSLLKKVYGIDKDDDRTPLTTKTCPRCGAQNPAQAKFCWNCGYPFEQVQIQIIKKETETEQLARKIAELLKQNPEILGQL